jgi:lysozyme family protein
MADFLKALPYPLSNEGRWACLAGDSGGMTYCGISRKNHPEWEGWKIIDAMHLPIHDAKACNLALAANPKIQQMVEGFYHTTYWAYDGIHSQAVATKLLDMDINMEGNGHAGSAIKIIQQAAAIQHPCSTDGAYGPATEAAINLCDRDALLMDMARLASEHYKAIVQSHPGDARFLPDWLRRAQKLPTDEQAVSAS